MILRVWSGCWSYAKGREMSMEWARVIDLFSIA